MRKRNLVIAMAIMAACLVFAGRDLIMGLFTIAGEWEVTYDWEPEGSPFSMTVTFAADNTYTTDEGDSGVWEMAGSEVTFTYTTGGGRDLYRNG